MFPAFMDNEENYYSIINTSKRGIIADDVTSCISTAHDNLRKRLSIARAWIEANGLQGQPSIIEAARDTILRLFLEESAGTNLEHILMCIHACKENLANNSLTQDSHDASKAYLEIISKCLVHEFDLATLTYNNECMTVTYTYASTEGTEIFSRILSDPLFPESSSIDKEEDTGLDGGPWIQYWPADQSTTTDNPTLLPAVYEGTLVPVLAEGEVIPIKYIPDMDYLPRDYHIVTGRLPNGELDIYLGRQRHHEIMYEGGEYGHWENSINLIRYTSAEANGAFSTFFSGPSFPESPKPEDLPLPTSTRKSHDYRALIPDFNAEKHMMEIKERSQKAVQTALEVSHLTPGTLWWALEQPSARLWAHKLPLHKNFTEYQRDLVNGFCVKHGLRLNQRNRAPVWDTERRHSIDSATSWRRSSSPVPPTSPTNSASSNSSFSDCGCSSNNTSKVSEASSNTTTSSKSANTTTSSGCTEKSTTPWQPRWRQRGSNTTNAKETDKWSALESHFNHEWNEHRNGETRQYKARYNLSSGSNKSGIGAGSWR